MTENSWFSSRLFTSQVTVFVLLFFDLRAHPPMSSEASLSLHYLLAAPLPLLLEGNGPLLPNPAAPNLPEAGRWTSGRALPFGTVVCGFEFRFGHGCL